MPLQSILLDSFLPLTIVHLIRSLAPSIPMLHFDQFSKTAHGARRVEPAAIRAPRDFADVKVAMRINGDTVWGGELARPFAGLRRAQARQLATAEIVDRDARA